MYELVGTIEAAEPTTPSLPGSLKVMIYMNFDPIFE